MSAAHTAVRSAATTAAEKVVAEKRVTAAAWHRRPRDDGPVATPGEQWDEVARRLGALDLLGDDLDARYAQPHRHYHATAHVAAVLRDARWLAERVGLAAAETDVLVLAAAAHDVVYDARPGDDERASAKWARAALRGAAADVVERVGALVLATADHEAVDDRIADVLFDADLAVLGGSAAAYDRYVAAVRREYAAVGDDAWRVGRGDVLRGLLARDPLYRTTPARERWARTACTNLTRELAGIGAHP